MKTIPHRHHAAGKRKIRQRLDQPVTAPSPEPVFTAANIHYEVADKTRAIACGGIGAIQLLVRRLGLAQAIDERLHLLKFHLPYHESDHVLNFAYNALCSGTCLDDIELRRNDVVFLDALGADRIPDPTTAGRLLPPLHCRRRRDSSKTSSIRPGSRSGNSSRPTSSTRPSSTPMARSSPPGPLQAGHRHRLRRRPGAITR